MTAPLTDADARTAIRDALADTMIVEAAAGTGKTTELVHRIVSVLASGRTSVERVVAVTFTEKAAGELKLRLRAALEHARQAAAAQPRRFVEAALAHLEEARISTIHGFCADLLRERPVEAGVDPQFRTLTDAQAQRLYAEGFDLWLQGQLEDPPQGVRRSLRRTAGGWTDDGPAARLRRAGWELATWRDFPAAWQRPAFDRREEIARLLEAVHELAALTATCGQPRKDRLYLDTEPARRLSTEIRRAERVRARDVDGVEAALVELARDGNFSHARKGQGAWYAKEIARTTVVAAHRDLVDMLARFATTADADLAAGLRNELWQTIERYETLKQRAGVLDFVDLLLRARNVLRDVAAVRRAFQQRFTHVFVDEFQDTDPLQAEILLLLAADDALVSDWRAVRPAPGKLFLVGDPKQSIYRFRRADVGMYQAVKRQLEAYGARVLHLSTSFRAVPAIQRAVNAAFAPVMNGDAQALQAEYVALQPFRADPPAQPSIVALPVPAPYGRTDRVTNDAIDQSLPAAVGAFVHWLVAESGWTVSERDRPHERVPIAARHVALLFRRFVNWGKDVTRDYVQALEARGVPHELVGGQSFHGREEDATMRDALTAIEGPDDELSVFATLRGSLFAIGDAELLAYRHQYGRLRPFRPADPDLRPSLAPVAEALAVLRDLHRGRNRRPVAETITQLLATTRAHAGFALRPSGEQVLANVLHLAELARAYEADGGISFRGFVERLREDTDGGEAAEAPILEEGSDGVRIMTVHKAKGLEFPVVVLADMTCRLAARQISRYIDPAAGLCAVRLAGWSPLELQVHEAEEHRRDEAEGVRVAYVAATRARDLLVVPAVGDEVRTAGWVAPLNPAIYPPHERWQMAEAAASCPSFGASTVSNRPASLAFDVAGVRPGLHRFDEGGYDVVWWDPTTLDLAVTPAFGLRRLELISKDADPAVVAADVAAYRAWEQARDGALAAGVVPSVRVSTATEHAAEDVAEDADVSVVELAADAARPFGPRYGALVHAVLASVSLDAPADQVAGVAVMHGRIVAATDEEVASAATVVGAALAHPLLRRAAAAAAHGQCRRETPVTLRCADGTLIEGVVDLAFCDDGAWTVIDFKTDRELGPQRARYARQVRFYADAITAATGQPASAVLLRV